MRRITKIRLENFRAYIQPLSIDLPGGENMLIYGENGSGKSSLYKALSFFLRSSVDSDLSFEVNYFSGRPDGSISITYSDVDADNKILPGTEHVYIKSTDKTISTNNQSFIKTSYRASGFLDYSKLLKVYLNNGHKPNMFSLITELLCNYVAVGVDTRTLSELINGIENELHYSYHRIDYNHKQGLADFNKLKDLFPEVINKLNAELKQMMQRYFQDMCIEIELVGAKAELFDPGRIKDMRVSGEVYVEVKRHGNKLPNYNDRLNEARLSAMATCLYLASLKLIANTNDTRLLFLDDVFIGLDLGNRLPVLEIIKKEFKDYQRIITTYDKSWYLQAKEVLSDTSYWKFYEMYEGEMKDAAGNKYIKPILVEADSLYGRSCFFLNYNEHPDYPASANYLRKAFEELLQGCVFDKAIRDENYEILASFRLSILVKSVREFVAQIPDYLVPQSDIASLLTDLAELLHPLLHPLSHYVPDIPTYKAELKKAMNIYDALREEFRLSDYANHCRVVIEKGIKIEFVVKGTSHWENHYIMRLKDNLYLYDDTDGGKSVSLCEMRVVQIIGFDTKGVKHQLSISPNNAVGQSMVYKSLQDCHDKIIHHILTADHKTDIVAQPLEEMFMIRDVTNVLHTLKDVLANKKANI